MKNEVSERNVSLDHIFCCFMETEEILGSKYVSEFSDARTTSLGSEILTSAGTKQSQNTKSWSWKGLQSLSTPTL